MGELEGEVLCPRRKLKSRCPSPASVVGGGITVNTRAGKMIACPNPCKCPGGLRTRWHGDVDSAVIEWNNLVTGYRRK